MEGQRDEATQSWAPEVLPMALYLCWSLPWVSGRLQMGLLLNLSTK